MSAGHSVLVVGGMVVLSYGLLLGIPMVFSRQRAAQAPRYLVAAHLAAIIQGAMLLALTVAAGFAGLSEKMETITAGLLVAGIVLFLSGLTANWLQGVQDAFGENSLGNKISGAGLPFLLAGAGILLHGVLAAV